MTAAAVILFVLAAINLLLGFQLLNAIGLFSLVIAAVQIFAGVKVLQLQSIGRTVGMVVAAIGAALALYAIVSGLAVQVVALALNGFIVYALAQNAASFTD